MTERPNVPVLKTGVGLPTVGSNPTPSATASARTPRIPTVPGERRTSDAKTGAIMKLMDATETLQFLSGTWRVRRDVTDYRDGDRCIFVGIATFSPSEESDGVLHFEEHGEMSIGPYRGPSTRRLTYQVHDGCLSVAFADGHHFIDLDLTDGTSIDTHLCNLDRYEITTVAKSADLLEERWRVVGPQKDYEAVTTLERS